MNMDEFLANLWNVDENQVPPQLNQSEPMNDREKGVGEQGSFSNIPTPLCKKTMDEVWFEIQKDLPQQQKTNMNAIDDHEPPQRQQTFGEMTLEDFLIKAGIVKEPNSLTLNQTSTDISLDVDYGSTGSAQQKMFAPIQNSNSNNNSNSNIASLDANFAIGMGLGFPGHQIMITKNSLDPAMLQNKNIIDGPSEEVVERRQRRMIKNRESAARSRARKQAYTVELELELNQLKQENAKLKQLVEENENRRRQEVRKRKQSTPAQRNVDKMRTLKRTVSLGW